MRKKLARKMTLEMQAAIVKEKSSKLSESSLEKDQEDGVANSFIDIYVERAYGSP